MKKVREEMGTEIKSDINLKTNTALQMKDAGSEFMVV